MINIAINGFGRIGRLILKTGINNKKIRFTAINDLTDPQTLAHLLRWDSVHGKFPGTIKAKKDSIIVNGKEIKITAEKDPKKLPWKKLKVDVALECTGRFRKYKAAALKSWSKESIAFSHAKRHKTNKTDCHRS